MNKDLFESLVGSDESSILDFKKINYALGSRNQDEDAKFIKDVVAFSNTIREESSYIIIGVEEIDGQKNLLGLDNNYDEALLQDKIKDKVNPKPKFKYFSFEYEEKRFGILEFPIHQYSAPITPVVRMRGLEIGKVYTRRGSTNSEATHLEAIQINAWITSVIPQHSKTELKKMIYDLIHDVQQAEYYSPYLSKALDISKQVNDSRLEEFCQLELMGWNKQETKFDWDHRNINCFTSFNRIMSANYPQGTHISVMWNQLKQDKDFWQRQIFLGDAISQMEDQIKGHRRGPGNQFTTNPIKASELFNDSKYSEKDYDLYMYWNEYDLAATYSHSKQQFVELLTTTLNNFG